MDEGKRKLCEVYTHDQIDSTNNEVERLLANGEQAPYDLANQQNKGRGRMGQYMAQSQG